MARFNVARQLQCIAGMNSDVTFESFADHGLAECVSVRVCCVARALAGTTPERPIVTTSDLVRKHGESMAIWLHGSRTPANLRALGRGM